MTYFIDLRADNAGGNPVADVNDIVIRTDTRPTPSTPLDASLIQAIQGRDVLLGTHGFHVNRANGIDSLNHWSQWLRLGDNGFFVGVLWPGDARWIPYLDYPIEGNEAIKSGQLLAQYLTRNFTGANSLSFASHSLGARVVLETIRNLSGRVASVTIMAGAIDDTCLTSEYSDAANRINKISVLYSSRDDVLKWAFTVANPVSGIVTRGDPYWHGALGRYGPNPPDQPSNLWKSPVLPDIWDFGHLSYVNCDGAIGGQPAESGAFFPPNLVVPPQQTQSPAATPTPASVRNWQQAWAAGFVSTRFA
jgi:hypothetical protein